MARQLFLRCAIAFGLMSAAQAQQPEYKVPDDMRAASRAAIDYAKALPDPWLKTSNDINWLLNNTPAQLREWIELDRSELAKASDALAALKLPAKTKDFDVSFALKRMRDEAEANLIEARKGLGALGSMIDAQAAGDCAAYAAHAEILERSNRAVQSFFLFKEQSALETLVVRFAGGTPPGRLTQVRPATLTHADRMTFLAQDLAVALRCPLPRGPIEIEVVSIPFLATATSKDTIYPHVRVASGVDASQRAEIEGRFTNAPLTDIQRYAGWKEMAPPLKFRWDGQVLTPVID